MSPARHVPPPQISATTQNRPIFTWMGSKRRWLASGSASAHSPRPRATAKRGHGSPRRGTEPRRRCPEGRGTAAAESHQYPMFSARMLSLRNKPWQEKRNSGHKETRAFRKVTGTNRCCSAGCSQQTRDRASGVESAHPSLI